MAKKKASAVDLSDPELPPMEQGIIHIEATEVPPITFFQDTFFNFVSKRSGVDLVRFIDVWRGVCKVVGAQLCHNRGTKIDKLGL